MYRLGPAVASPAAVAFLSQYTCADTVGVDVLAQDVAVLPGTHEEAFGFDCPPLVMVGPVLQQLREC